MGHEKDTSSMITTGARNLTVFKDNDDFAGAVQRFGEERRTEVDAIDAAMNPKPDPDEIDWDDLVEAMRDMGMEWCNGRCQTFKDKTLFSLDERNKYRGCKSYCKECEARRDFGKRTALLSRDVQAQQAYEYRARKKKKRGKKK